MGPPIYIGGNCPRLREPACWLECFNGATDLHRWKRPMKTVEAEITGTASMGPPIYIGGNPCSTRPMYPQGLWLQWGHRFTSVETASFRVIFSRFPRLQWGHRFTSVETFLKPIQTIGLIKLQWGHRFTSVETIRAPGPTTRQGGCFNGATDLHRWKPLELCSHQYLL